MKASRLLRIIVVSGLLISAMSWWFSFHRYFEAYFSPRSSSWTVSADFYAATLSIGLNPYDQARHAVHTSFYAPNRFNRPMRDASGWFGRLAVGRSLVRGIGEGAGHYFYFVAIPIWLLYLLSIGLAFSLINFSIKRSSRFKERQLAEQGGDGDAEEAV